MLLRAGSFVTFRGTAKSVVHFVRERLSASARVGPANVQDEPRRDLRSQCLLVNDGPLPQLPASGWYGRYQGMSRRHPEWQRLSGAINRGRPTVSDEGA